MEHVQGQSRMSTAICSALTHASTSGWLVFHLATSGFTSRVTMACNTCFTYRCANPATSDVTTKHPMTEIPK